MAGGIVSRRAVIGAGLAAASGVGVSFAETEGEGRLVPERRLPVPDTVSPELAVRIGAPLPAGWDVIPKDAAGWRAMAAESAAVVAPLLPGIKERMGLRVASETIAGVPVFHIRPREAVAGPLLMHLHGGGYVLYPGEAGAGEGMVMAGYGGYEVISVDYRMAPDHPFPAALDDAVAVWRVLSSERPASRLGVFGSSAGGGLTLALMLRLKAEGLDLPGAIAPGTPWVDLTGDGDSLRANAFVDNVLVAETGWVGAAGPLYAGGADVRDPMISPIFGDFAGLPPAILTSGTRDLFLSDTVRAHRKLRQAGVEAVLQVFEGQSHAQFLEPFIPETEEAFGEIAGFFGKHLAG